ncbi:MAG: MASE1 domain-containing protein [Thermomicrobiales bacterium]
MHLQLLSTHHPVGGTSRSPWTADVAIALAVAGAYFVAARLGLALLTQPDGVAVFWPAAGLAAGAMIGLGAYARLPIIAGVAGATILANVLGDRNIWSAFVFAACNVAEAVIVAGLIHRFYGGSFSLNRLHQVLGLVAAMFVGTAVSGVGGAIGFRLFHDSTAYFHTIWLHWFASDAIGMLAVAPFVIGLCAVVRHPPSHRELAEGALALAAIGALCSLCVLMPNTTWVIEVTVAALFPLLLWISSRCGPCFAAVGAFIMALTIVCATTLGVGVFGLPDLSTGERVLTAQVAILALSFCTLVLAALFAERRDHIDALTERQEQLQSALEAAERADRAKTTFLAAASHDLRQPLQTLNLLQASLNRRVRDAETSAVVDEMGHSVKVMNGILVSLLDVSRLESGTLQPQFKDFPINEVIALAEKEFARPMSDKGLVFRLVRSKAIVRSDRQLLEVILRNLLSNAVRYTDSGRVLMGCRRGCGTLRIEVWDTGAGILEHELPRVFEEYYQGANRGKSVGFGLGLAIVQRLGKLLNHPIGVRSAPGKGSCFFVEVPLGTEAELELADDESVYIDAMPRVVLVIEDNYSVRSSLVSLFESANCKVMSAATMGDALAQVGNAKRRPDVIVTDYNLPGEMNGVSAVNALRRALAWKVPAIVLTGDTRTKVMEEVSSRDIHLSFKPIRGDILLKLVSTLHDVKDTSLV